MSNWPSSWWLFRSRYGRLCLMWSRSTGVALADRYLLIERLGAGGMSVVWRGMDQVLGRRVAIKVLASPIAEAPAFRAVIQREARAAARLAHPHITQIYDYGEASLPDGKYLPYVVMELLDGQTLAQRLQDGPLPWADAVGICAQVADALAAAHHRGIVHRDIAPGNIMLTPTGAKILDFGIAALAGSRGDPEGSGQLGTPAYVAPERLDDAPAAPAGDLYGLGAMLYQALTGGTPLPATTWEALADAYRDGVVIPPLRTPGLPEEVARLCERCLAPDPKDRPGGAEAAQVLRTAVDTVRCEARRASAVPVQADPATGTDLPREQATRRNSSGHWPHAPTARTAADYRRLIFTGRRRLVLALLGGGSLLLVALALVGLQVVASHSVGTPNAIVCSPTPLPTPASAAKPVAPSPPAETRPAPRQPEPNRRPPATSATQPAVAAPGPRSPGPPQATPRSTAGHPQAPAARP